MIGNLEAGQIFASAKIMVSDLWTSQIVALPVAHRSDVVNVAMQPGQLSGFEL